MQKNAFYYACGSARFNNNNSNNNNNNKKASKIEKERKNARA